ncbi:hypothetical protein Pmani_001428 [Petrolisthes manimaculis]|uniref:C2H2-type domain-containing protein n=1 Tax=Petrolisthes manimaculis TaxID=1843537 RepID=A0AAE1QM88_9EUCA|nr:hypothetical protein Pmani_001428 [Petrolisthes manimaculis]
MQEQQQQHLRAILESRGQLSYYGLRFPSNTSAPSSSPSTSPRPSTSTTPSTSASTPAISGDTCWSVRTDGVEEMQGKVSHQEARKTPNPPSRMVTRSQTAAVRAPPAPPSQLDNNTLTLRYNHGQKRSHSGEERKWSSTLSRQHPAVSPDLPPVLGLDEFPGTKNPSGPGSGIEFGSVCGECGMVVVTGVCWAAHKTAHLSMENACQYCPQVFLTSNGCQAHSRFHRHDHVLVDDMCDCGVCGGTFISVQYLELHVLQMHGRPLLQGSRWLRMGTNDPPPCCPEKEANGRPLYRCGSCSIIFNFSVNLDCHMALHPGSEAHYTCAICNAAFTALESLRTHVATHPQPEPTCSQLACTLPTCTQPMGSHSKTMCTQPTCTHPKPTNPQPTFSYPQPITSQATCSHPQPISSHTTAPYFQHNSSYLPQPTPNPQSSPSPQPPALNKVSLSSQFHLPKLTSLCSNPLPQPFLQSHSSQPRSFPHQPCTHSDTNPACSVSQSVSNPQTSSTNYQPSPTFRQPSTSLPIQTPSSVLNQPHSLVLNHPSTGAANQHEFSSILNHDSPSLLSNQPSLSIGLPSQTLPITSSQSPASTTHPPHHTPGPPFFYPHLPAYSPWGHLAMGRGRQGAAMGLPLTPALINYCMMMMYGGGGDKSGGDGSFPSQSSIPAFNLPINPPSPYITRPASSSFSAAPVLPTAGSTTPLTPVSSLSTPPSTAGDSSSVPAKTTYSIPAQSLVASAAISALTSDLNTSCSSASNLTYNSVPSPATSVFNYINPYLLNRNQYNPSSTSSVPNHNQPSHGHFFNTTEYQDILNRISHSQSIQLNPTSVCGNTEERDDEDGDDDDDDDNEES